MENNKKIKEAVEELDAVSNNNELRRLAQLREKAIRDEAAALELATERGIEKGATNKAVEIAKNMLKKNTDIKFIQEVTGLTMVQLEQIKSDL